MVVDSFGAWDKESVDIINLIAQNDAERNEVSFSIRKNLIYQKLSISLQKSNARTILTQQRMLKNFNNNLTQEDNQNYVNVIIDENVEMIEKENNLKAQSNLNSNNDINLEVEFRGKINNDNEKMNNLVNENNIEKNKKKKKIHNSPFIYKKRKLHYIKKVII